MGQRNPKPTGVFPDSVEYPSMPGILDNGLVPGVFHEYVTHTYVGSHLPYLKPVRAILLERYRDDPTAEDPEDRPITDEEIETVLSKFHTNFGDFQDDVVFAGETETYWWVIHLDCDVSDCCIGRVRKADVSKEQFSAWVDWYVNPDDERYSAWKPRYEIPLDRLTGWLQFKGA